MNTPKTWRRARGHESNWDDCIVQENRIIARISSWSSDREAHADLIAQAPQLARELQILRQYIDTQGGPGTADMVLRSFAGNERSGRPAV